MPTQPDLFAPDAPAPLDPALVESVRQRLLRTLALVEAAEAMPWPGQLDWVREDNAFRYGVALLPPDEGAALWARFDPHMDRLYAIVNAGLPMDEPGA